MYVCMYTHRHTHTHIQYPTEACKPTADETAGATAERDNNPARCCCPPLWRPKYQCVDAFPSTYHRRRCQGARRVCVFVSVSVSESVSCVCVFVCAYTNIYICMHIYVMYLHVDTYTYIYIHVDTSTYVHIHQYMLYVGARRQPYRSPQNRTPERG